MKTLIENEKVQSILHMVVNSGEQSHYPLSTKLTMESLAEEFFLGDLSAARKYIEALLTVEVYNFMPEYGIQTMEQASKVVYELHSTLMGFLNTKGQESSDIPWNSPEKMF